MSDFEHTMLPQTATDLAKAMDLLEERLMALPVAMITKDPWKVATGLLDHLAWEYSVDVWDIDWPDDVKRNVISVAAEVHRFKGTPHSVKLALSVFDIETEFLEWWQPDGVAAGMEPGSFRVTAYASTSLYGDTENSINAAMLHAMTSVVRAASPVSRSLIFRLGERFGTDAYLRAGTRLQIRDETDHDPHARPHEAETEMHLRTGLRAKVVFAEVHDPHARPFEALSGFYIRTGLRHMTRSSLTHDPERKAAS